MMPWITLVLHYIDSVLCIFCSVDRGSVAEASGIRVGDQILEVNGRSFEGILHNEAVNLFKSHGDVIITVKVTYL